ncbi:MAG TPA: murein biosynthesis integral membrane protein MurJ [Thermoanaerobaculia bacterium]|nr:murein biosynthesis integral membrane protein MurJ [Thermoanaerobaculia bacterium]
MADIESTLSYRAVPDSNSESSAPAPKPARRAGGFAALVGAGILLSRISGLVREKVFAHFLGNSDAAGVFKAAIRIPNLLQNLFGEGVLSASFIPVYAKLLAEGDEETAGRVAGIVASLLALVVALVVLLGVIFTPQLLIVIAPGFTGAVRALTIVVVRIMFPAIGLLVLSAWCLGILNSHRRFFLSYVAPVLMNIVMIATLVIFGRHSSKESLAIAAAWGTVVGAAAQFLVQVPFVLRHEKRLRFAIDTTLAPVREVMRNFTPVVISRGVVQLSAYLDNLIATLLGTAAVSGLGYAQTIYLLPVSLFGMSVAASELPQMASALGTDDEVRATLRKRIERGLRQITFFVVPSAVAFVMIGNVLVAALYQGGAFHGGDTRFVWYVLIGSTVGLVAATLGRLYSSGFYALRDTRTPLRFAIIRVTITGILGFLFAIPLRPLLVSAMTALHVPLPNVRGGTMSLGAIALTATAGIAGWVEFLLLRNALQKRLGRFSSNAGYEVKLWSAAILGGVGGILAERFTHALPHIVEAMIVAGIFGVLYFAVAMALGVPEARATLGRFTRR